MKTMNWLLVIPLLYCSIGCEEQKEDQNQVNEVITPANAEKELGLVDTVPAADFCTAISKFTLEGDGFKDEISVLCDENNKGSKALEELLSTAAQGANAQINLAEYKSSEDEDVEQSTLLIGFALKLPLKTTEIRDADLYQQLTAGVDVEYHTVGIEILETTAKEGLHLSSRKMNYDTFIIGPQSTEFRNVRDTEVNSYQVVAGNDNIGFATEHLLNEADNGDYYKANTINLTLGNEAEGFSYQISIVSFVTWNRGFHNTNVRSLKTISEAQGQIILKNIGE